MLSISNCHYLMSVITHFLQGVTTKAGPANKPLASSKNGASKMEESSSDTSESDSDDEEVKV